VRRVERLSTQQRLVAQEPPTQRQLRQLVEYRPKTRGECGQMARPCPFVGCRHHLGLEVIREGSIRFPVGTLEVWQLAETCSLDVADRDEELSSQQVAQLLGVSRQAVDVIERLATLKIRAAIEEVETPKTCDLCPRPAVWWVGGCGSHAKEFAVSRVGSLVAVGRLTLERAWDRWVESRQNEET
jgi:hypothetical protein